MSGPGVGTGLFGPGSLTWRINREAALLLGGGRALLLQVAHPLVAAGVEQHSRYATHPWRRLYDTLDVTTKIVFGDDGASDRASARLAGAHATVRGTSADATPYDARDPALLLWVWATLVDTAVLVHERCLTPLTAAERDRYVAEQERFAIACGVPSGLAPRRWDTFRAYFDETLTRELRVGADARAVVRSVVGRGRAFAAVDLLTAGLLPEDVRAQYGLPWSARRERTLGVLFAGVRATLPLLPRPLRDFPAATTARRATYAD